MRRVVRREAGERGSARNEDQSVLTRIRASRWSMGSALFLASWAVLLGPVTYTKHLISASRLPFTAVYFGSIALTLLFAFQVRPLLSSTGSRSSSTSSRPHEHCPCPAPSPPK